MFVFGNVVLIRATVAGVGWTCTCTMCSSAVDFKPIISGRQQLSLANVYVIDMVLVKAR